MAHSLRLKVVAEGVETAAQLQFLRSQCCDAAQGFFLCPPLREEELGDVLRRNRLGCSTSLAISA
jgi:EAL domain-containing protein (putative c-di-GMP-specific phosphodiesterase class I)